jgi:hypothetical protein
MELREKIADAIVESGNQYFSDPYELGHRPSVLAMADAVLAIPEIAEALNPPSLPPLTDAEMRAMLDMIKPPASISLRRSR